jgi:hypothetical protein
MGNTGTTPALKTPTPKITQATKIVIAVMHPYGQKMRSQKNNLLSKH